MVKRQVTCTYAKQRATYNELFRMLAVSHGAGVRVLQFFSRSIHLDDSFYLFAV